MSDANNPIDLQDGTTKKSLTAYLIGYVISLVLLVVAFLMMQERWFGGEGLYIALSFIMLLLLITQVCFFLRLSASPEGQWNLISFLFTILIIAIIMTGSLWIMYNLNYNMVYMAVH